VPPAGKRLPCEGEIPSSRLIDRLIRPLFIDDFTNEVQIIATIKSLNPAVVGQGPTATWTCSSQTPNRSS
jgi:polyribonucleotide nucleotidyltransferase